MAQKVNWAMKTGLSVFRSKNFSPSISNVSRQYCRQEMSGSEILNPFKAAQSIYLFQHSRAFSITYDEAVKRKKETKTDKILIYFGTLGSNIKAVKVVSYSTSLISLIAQPYFYNDVMALSIPATALVYTMMGFFTFVTPLLIHSVTKRYVTEIKYDPSGDTYTAKTLTFFLRDKIVNFRLSDIKKIDSPSLFNTFNINGKPVIVFENGFLEKQHYIKMMGYDKPIDLGLEPNVTDNEAVNSQSQK